MVSQGRSGIAEGPSPSRRQGAPPTALSCLLCPGLVPGFVVGSRPALGTLPAGLLGQVTPLKGAVTKSVQGAWFGAVMPSAASLDRCSLWFRTRGAPGTRESSSLGAIHCQAPSADGHGKPSYPSIHRWPPESACRWGRWGLGISLGMNMGS